jgi:predicted nucleic acid-binding protein
MKSATQPRILLDTNILLAYLNAQHPRHTVVWNRIQQLMHSGYQLLLAPQCLYEFYVVATRPIDQNGLGLSPNDAEQHIRNLTAVFTVLDDAPSMVQAWLTLCQSYQISGKHAHDMRLVAWMQKHGVSDLLTLNPADFQQFQGLISVQQV